jgi:hypothetical protein
MLVDNINEPLSLMKFKIKINKSQAVLQTQHFHINFTTMLNFFFFFLLVLIWTHRLHHFIIYHSQLDTSTLL